MKTEIQLEDHVEKVCSEEVTKTETRLILWKKCVPDQLL